MHLGCQLTDSTSLENFRTHSLTLSGWFRKINFWYFFCCDRNRKVILGHTWIEYARMASHPGAWWEQLCSHCWTNDVLLKVWTIILIVRERSTWVDFKIQNSYWVFIWIFRLRHLFKLLNRFFIPLVTRELSNFLSVSDKSCAGPADYWRGVIFRQDSTTYL